MMINAPCKCCGEIFTKEYKNQKYCSIKCANKINPQNQPRPVKLPEYSNDLAEFMGIIFGDGTVSDFYSKIWLNSLADRDYIPFVEKLAKSLFPGATVTSGKDKKDGASWIQISSKIVSSYLQKIGFNFPRRVPSWIKKNPKFIKAFIRGLFDTEGSVGLKKFNGRNGKYLYKQLTFTNKSLNLLNFVPKHLKKLGMKPTMNSRKNIYISNLKDICFFLKTIGLHNPKLIQKALIKDYNNYRTREGRGQQKRMGVLNG